MEIDLKEYSIAVYKGTNFKFRDPMPYPEPVNIEDLYQYFKKKMEKDK